MNQKLGSLGIFLGIISFLAFSAKGQPQFEWVQPIASKKNVSGNAITVDKDGYIYTVGEFQDTAHIQIGNALTTFPSQGGRDAFLSKQDPLGNFLWIRNFGTAEANAIAVKRQGRYLHHGKLFGHG